MAEKKKDLILIVDDHLANLKVLFAFLKDEGFDIRILESGAQAVELLSHTLPDLILLDVMMPDMDGFTLCRRIKSAPRTENIPIIFLTALDDVKDKIAGFEAGGADYVTKPFQQIELLARINTHLTLRKREMELKQALAEVKKLSGILPLCSYCKKIRNDKEQWEEVDVYIYSHSEADISHSICPECMKEHYPKEYKEIYKDT